MGKNAKQDLHGRRQFLKSTGMMVGALSGIALSRPSLAVPPPASIPYMWNTTVDVLVIGSGFAGLAAAIEARNAQADVLVIDKMPTFGGNSMLNDGRMAVVGTNMQTALGITDSPEQMYQDMMRVGCGFNCPVLARIVAERSLEAFEWVKHLGGQFVSVVNNTGHTLRREHQMAERAGSGLVVKQHQKAQELGAVIEQRTKLLRLIVDKQGGVIGAEVRRGYQFPDESSGVVAYIRAKKGVVIACGGFSQGVALRQMFVPRLTSDFASTNHLGATGEALMAASQIGALTKQMECIELASWTSPDEVGFVHVPQFVERMMGFGVMVDPVTGKRFVKETGTRKERTDAIVQLGHPALLITDKTNTLKRMGIARMHDALQNGSIKTYETLEDIARAYNMPITAFLAQVARWNGFVEQDLASDPDLGCLIFKGVSPTSTPPFYVVRLWPQVHHTMGGLAINKNAQVVGCDLLPIPRLYAAGEAASGVHGAVRLGGVATTECIVFGRIAGQNAAGMRI